MLHERIRIPHLIIIPRKDFDEVAVGDASEGKVGDGGEMGADDVA